MAVQGCMKPPPPRPGPVAAPHYFLGKPYQASGHWFYPAENYALDATGIAAIETPAAGLTADGELADPTSLTAAMPTIQLPAIAEITNLENGRQIAVRVNDRGPADPARLVALSPRAATLLRVPPEGARIRVQVIEAESRRLIDQLGGGPTLAIAAAPRAAITAESLPPPGHGAAGPAHLLGAPPADPVQAHVPDRLPEVVRQVFADPGTLYLRCGSFGRFDYANGVVARLYGLGAQVLRSREGREQVFAVRAGPFATIPQADRALAEALRDGVIDAHITVE